ncbi:hypothetical protein B296_00030363 [Ensete ventricosum]|uniref:Uncharacterized protein n=1 Tax=Ensete ventricosum TaxID=4639 RepID=A0A426XPA2_ENSVE|nr:hypothetical protein B296_00030363 [Ensete ventricosum]
MCRDCLKRPSMSLQLPLLLRQEPPTPSRLHVCEASRRPNLPNARVSNRWERQWRVEE